MKNNLMLANVLAVVDNVMCEVTGEELSTSVKVDGEGVSFDEATAVMVKSNLNGGE